MKTKTQEEPNFSTKSSVGRVKSKKDRRINTEGLHIVEDFYKPNMKYGIQSLVDDELDDFDGGKILINSPSSVNICEPDFGNAFKNFSRSLICSLIESDCLSKSK